MRAICLLPLLLMACEPGGNLFATPPPPPEQIGDADWSLASFKGARMDEMFTADFSGGFIAGEGPCNRITGNYLGTGDVFLVETVVSTRRSCPDLPLEQEIIETLLTVTSATVEDGVLFFSTEDGTRVMSFLPVYPEPPRMS